MTRVITVCALPEPGQNSSNLLASMHFHWLTTVPPVSSALAAIAACVSAYFSKRSVDEARRIATDQIKTAKTTARANALSSRIAFYNEQLKGLDDYIAEVKVGAIRPQEGPTSAIQRAKETMAESLSQRDHLGWQLDRELDDLGVGLRRTSPGSPYNDKVPGWSKVPTKSDPS
jgi:hypothetical protein